jgi:hypothetical protein
VGRRIGFVETSLERDNERRLAVERCRQPGKLLLKGVSFGEVPVLGRGQVGIRGADPLELLYLERVTAGRRVEGLPCVRKMSACFVSTA